MDLQRYVIPFRRYSSFTQIDQGIDMAQSIVHLSLGVTMKKRTLNNIDSTANQKANQTATMA